jgi:hypothetical protein
MIMLLQRQRLRPILDRVMIGLLAGATLLCALASARAGDKLSLYAYSDTRASLVSLVEEAARLMERDGEQALAIRREGNPSGSTATSISSSTWSMGLACVTRSRRNWSASE